MRQLFTRSQMTDKLTTIGHRTAYNNENVSLFCLMAIIPRLLFYIVLNLILG